MNARSLLCLALAFVSFVSASALGESLDLTTASIVELNAAMDAGALTSEKLVELSLARIEAFDQQGPMLNAVITINPRALETARELDRERVSRGRRSPIHGIPFVLKDNFDTADMPTTAGSVMLEGSIPPDDAFVVKKLRDAGAIILAKLNMSEFASGAAMSSVRGVMHNPHDPERSPSGSSGGTGIAIAAAYGTAGLGTDTGGSVRGPSSANGIVGLKPTHGLLSRDGIVPLGLTFDTGGPMARSVSDLALALGVMTGVDPADPATSKSEGRYETDYARFLDENALEGARLGVARDFMGEDGDVDWVVEASLARLKAKGATLVDVKFPRWFLESREELYTTIRHREFPAQIGAYLATTGPQYPKTIEDLIERSQTITSRTESGAVPNPVRWSLFLRERDSGTLEDYEYLAVRDYALPLMRAVVEGVMREERLDAIVYPTAGRRPSRVDADPGSGGSGFSATNIANLTGFPDLIVPAGFTGGGLPVSLSFLGTAFTEPRLIALGYAFEQATHALRTPVHTPPLPGEHIQY